MLYVLSNALTLLLFVNHECECICVGVFVSVLDVLVFILFLEMHAYVFKRNTINIARDDW